MGIDFKLSRRGAVARRTMALAGIGLFTAGLLVTGPAQAAGDRIRKIVIISVAQAGDPNEFQAAQITAQEWRKLGLEVEVRGLPRPQVSQIVWYERDRWDVAMWRMIGRPERSDPDELVYNLFHSSTREKGFNFVGYSSPEYDKLAEAQRVEIDQAKRKEIIGKAQDMIDKDKPYLFLVYPKNISAFNSKVWKKDTIVDQAGIGARNFWSFSGATPLTDKKDMVISGADALNAINPLYISGATDSWVTDLVWDRLMRVGPDGLPKPWAAESVKYLDSTTIEVKMRAGMKWHDGKPVTAEDVIYSFQAPAGNKSPMYRPFVASIASVTKKDDATVIFKLKAPNASFFTSSLAKINLIPKHVWEPILAGLGDKNAESYQEQNPVGSGPFKVRSFKLQEEIVLERNADHWAAPKYDRWILRIVPNVEATLGMLRRGEITFIGEYRGDPQLLSNISKQQTEIEVAATVDMGFRFVAPNLRRPPFDDPKFRGALMAALNRNVFAQAAWNGFAVPANSHVSAALPFWHKSTPHRANIEEAKKMLKDAGYELVGGRLHYPTGKKEGLQPLN
jgi:peptide/nickel transport system substrate-binding protein